MNQAFSKIWIIAIVVILIAGGIFAWQYFVGIPTVEVPEVKMPEKIIEDETADWKIYRNEEYGFEIKYPEDWSYAKDIVRSSVDSPAMVFCSPVYYDPKEGCKLKRVQNVTTNLGEIRLFIGKWSNLPAYLGTTKEEKKEGEMNCYSDPELRIINGINVEICTQANGAYSAFWEDSTGSYLYHLHGFYDQNPEIFDLMLSTFKFLE